MSADMMKTNSAGVLEPTEQMWREVLPQLRKFVRRRIADTDRADDLVADILLRIHQNAASLDDRELLPNWVFRIARNAVIDEYRRAGRSREQLTPTLPDQLVAPSMDEDESAAVRELSACLRPMLKALSADQREALEMVDLAGLTQADAAQQAGVSLSGMKSRVQRGRRRLAELLGQCCALTLDGRGVPMDYEPAPGCGCAKD
ncbi:MAG: sigma-70 family RNA polymerase sigma factor [Mycobacteriaceae bacterium]|nr:sigma-70 family RNA polymerase sigma factor [Mycobacteriaceae bacterium]